MSRIRRAGRRLRIALGSAVWLAGLLALDVAAAPTLLVDPDPLGTVAAFPPGLATTPGVPDRAWLPRPENFPSVDVIDLAAYDYTGAFWPLPDDDRLDCSASPAFSVPQMASLALDPLGDGRLRGWLTTSGCELVVPFDALAQSDWPLLVSGAARISINTRLELPGAFTSLRASGGRPLDGWTTNFTASALRVGDRLLVATGNFLAVGSDPELAPGTVLLFDVDDSVAPTRITPADPAFIVTTDPNPTALTALPGGRVAVTNTGLLDPAFPPLVTGDGSIDLIDAAAGALVGSIPLAGNPGGRRIALDPSGSVGVLSSHTFRRLYAVDLRGVAALPIAAADVAAQRASCHQTVSDATAGLPCLRERVVRGAANPIALPPAPGTPPDAFGFVPAVAFSPDGRFVAAVSFNDGGLGLVAFDGANLERPHPLLDSRFGAPATLRATAPGGTLGQDCCPGAVVVARAGPSGFAGSRVFWTSGSPDGAVFAGTLAGDLPAAEGDLDRDGVLDAADVCPREFDPEQADGGGFATSVPDGVGDACQCGDLDASARVDADDVTHLRDAWLGQATVAAPELCNVQGPLGPEDCDLADAIVLTRALAAPAPAALPGCAPFGP